MIKKFSIARLVLSVLFVSLCYQGVDAARRRRTIEEARAQAVDEWTKADIVKGRDRAFVTEVQDEAKKGAEDLAKLLKKKKLKKYPAYVAKEKALQKRVADYYKDFATAIKDAVTKSSGTKEAKELANDFEKLVDATHKDIKSVVEKEASIKLDDKKDEVDKAAKASVPPPPPPPPALPAGSGASAPISAPAAKAEWEKVSDVIVASSITDKTFTDFDAEIKNIEAWINGDLKDAVEKALAADKDKTKKIAKMKSKTVTAVDATTQELLGLRTTLIALKNQWTKDFESGTVTNANTKNEAEATAFVDEVKDLQKRVGEWKVSDAKATALLKQFSDIVDGVVTAINADLAAAKFVDLETIWTTVKAWKDGALAKLIADANSANTTETEKITNSPAGKYKELLDWEKAYEDLEKAWNDATLWNKGTVDAKADFTKVTKKAAEKFKTDVLDLTKELTNEWEDDIKPARKDLIAALQKVIDDAKSLISPALPVPPSASTPVTPSPSPSPVPSPVPSAPLAGGTPVVAATMTDDEMIKFIQDNKDLRDAIEKVTIVDDSNKSVKVFTIKDSDPGNKLWATFIIQTGKANKQTKAGSKYNKIKNAQALVDMIDNNILVSDPEKVLAIKEAIKKLIIN